MTDIPISPIRDLIKDQLKVAKLLGNERDVVLHITAAQAWSISIALGFYQRSNDGVLALPMGSNPSALVKSTHIIVPDEIPHT